MKTKKGISILAVIVIMFGFGLMGNSNQAVANGEDEICDTLYIIGGEADCHGVPINCFCPIIIEEDGEG